MFVLLGNSYQTTYVASLVIKSRYLKVSDKKISP
jgi:hypothetical protein